MARKGQKFKRYTDNEKDEMILAVIIISGKC